MRPFQWYKEHMKWVSKSKVMAKIRKVSFTRPTTVSRGWRLFSLSEKKKDLLFVEEENKTSSLLEKKTRSKKKRRLASSFLEEKKKIGFLFVGEKKKIAFDMSPKGRKNSKNIKCWKYFTYRRECRDVCIRG
jgi:hypothetical protein